MRNMREEVWKVLMMWRMNLVNLYKNSKKIHLDIRI